MSDARFISEQERYRRLSEQGRSEVPRDIVLCAKEGCRHAASYGPFCHEHQRGQRDIVGEIQVAKLTKAELAALRAEISLKAALLFILAMDWIVRQQVEEFVRQDLELASGLPS